MSFDIFFNMKLIIYRITAVIEHSTVIPILLWLREKKSKHVTIFLGLYTLTQTHTRACAHKHTRIHTHTHTHTHIYIYIYIYITSYCLRLYVAFILNLLNRDSVWLTCNINIYLYIYMYIYIYVCVCVCVCVCAYVRGSYNKFPDFFRLGNFFYSTYMKF